MTTGSNPTPGGVNHLPQWDEVVTCKLCGHTSRAQWKRTGYRDGAWICLSRRACRSRQRLAAARKVLGGRRA